MEEWLQGFLVPQVLRQRVCFLSMVGYVSGGAAIVAVLSLPFLRGIQSADTPGKQPNVAFENLANPQCTATVAHEENTLT